MYDDTWKAIDGKEENNVWKDGELVATPTHPGEYTANTISASGIYEKHLQVFNLHYAVHRVTINFIHNTYKETEVLINPQNIVRKFNMLKLTPHPFFLKQTKNEYKN